MISCFLASTSQKKNVKVFVFLVKLYRGVFHPNVFQQKMEKCLYFWLNYKEEYSTLSFSTKNRKVFIFLVRLYRGVFHPIIFSLTVNFLSLQGWEGDW